MKTFIADNDAEWDLNLNLTCLAYNVAVNGTTGLTPFEMTFGRKANLSSILATTTSINHQELLDIWKKRHESYQGKGKESIRKTQERLKILQDSRIVISNPIFEVGDLVLIHNETKQNKLDSEWIGPGTVMQRSSKTNFQILFENKYYIIHVNRLKPYYQ